MGEFDYEKYLSKVPIEKGDVVDVSSDMLSMIMFAKSQRQTLDPNRLIDCIKNKVGEQGTVMIRSFTWDFCSGETFDIRSSPSRVGSLGNVALARNDFRRTKHPLYNWMIWGKEQERLCSLDYITAFGKNSMFYELYEMKAKQLSLGNMVSVAMTQFHHAEVMAEVPYRYEKEFTGKYVDVYGKEYEKTYCMHVRPLNIAVTVNGLTSDEFQDELRKTNIRKDYLYEGKLQCSLLYLKDATEYFVDMLKENDGRQLVEVNGMPGIHHNEVEWGEARYN